MGSIIFDLEEDDKIDRTVLPAFLILVSLISEECEYADVSSLTERRPKPLSVDALAFLIFLSSYTKLSDCLNSRKISPSSAFLIYSFTIFYFFQKSKPSFLKKKSYELRVLFMNFPLYNNIVNINQYTYFFC